MPSTVVELSNGSSSNATLHLANEGLAASEIQLLVPKCGGVTRAESNNSLPVLFSLEMEGKRVGSSACYFLIPGFFFFINLVS